MCIVCCIGSPFDRPHAHTTGHWCGCAGTAAATNFALSDYRRDLAEYHRMQQVDCRPGIPPLFESQRKLNGPLIGAAVRSLQGPWQFLGNSALLLEREVEHIATGDKGFFYHAIGTDALVAASSPLRSRPSGRNPALGGFTAARPVKDHIMPIS